MMTEQTERTEGMFIVQVGDTYHGPFLCFEVGGFAKRLGPEAQILPLTVPRWLKERESSPLKVQIVSDESHAERVDAVKCDTLHYLAAITQEVFFTQRDNCVLTTPQMAEISSMTLNRPGFLGGSEP